MKIREIDCDLYHLDQFYISLSKANRLLVQNEPVRKTGKLPRKGKKNGKRTKKTKRTNK